MQARLSPVRLNSVRLNLTRSNSARLSQQELTQSTQLTWSTQSNGSIREVSVKNLGREH
ncbi:hypothetical protein HanRHA438_Chr02g0057071 [Helianthus annuus]|nr:hypothetical protein HanRHA438_Chr02g0057071 [Helianthus annuus]